MRKSLMVLGLCIASSTLIQCSSKSKAINGKTDASTAADGDANTTTMIEEAGQQGKGKDGKKFTGAAPVTSIPSSAKTSAPSVEKPMYVQLNQYIKNQDDDNILKEGSSLLMKSPTDVKAINAMAMAYYKRSQFVLAKSLLLRALKL